MSSPNGATRNVNQSVSRTTKPFLDKRIFEFTEYARAKAAGRLSPDHFQWHRIGPLKRAERILPPLSRMIINNYGTSLELHDKRSRHH